TTAQPARAELAYFTTGRTLSIKSHRLEAGSLILALRGGGEIVTDASVIDRFAPDEVPYPEDQPASVTPDTTDTAGSGRLEADARYGAIIDKVAAANGVPPRLVAAVIK